MAAPLRREQLLDVTMGLVAAEGFPAISIQSVAQRAGISRPIIYEHFGDLPGLLEALVQRETARALAQVSETVLPDLIDPGPAELMLESLRRYLSAVAENPATWRLVLMPPEGAPALLRKGIVAGRAAAHARLVGELRQTLADSDDAPDPELTATTLSAVADEYARSLLTDPARFPAERLLEHARWWLDRLLP